MSVISAIWNIEARGSQVQGQPERLIETVSQNKK